LQSLRKGGDEKEKIKLGIKVEEIKIEGFKD